MNERSTKELIFVYFLEKEDMYAFFTNLIKACRRKQPIKLQEQNKSVTLCEFQTRNSRLDKKWKRYPHPIHLFTDEKVTKTNISKAVQDVTGTST